MYSNRIRRSAERDRAVEQRSDAQRHRPTRFSSGRRSPGGIWVITEVRLGGSLVEGVVASVAVAADACLIAVLRQT